MAKWQVVITDDGYAHYDIEREVLAAVEAQVTVRMCDTEDDVIALAKETDADGVIVRLQPFSENVMEAVPKVRVCGRYGIGVDNIDCEAATRHGVAVGNCFRVHGRPRVTTSASARASGTSARPTPSTASRAPRSGSSGLDASRRHS